MGTVSKEKAAYLWNELTEYEKHTKMTFEQPLLSSTTFIQEIERKFDSVVNKTAKEYNIKL